MSQKPNAGGPPKPQNCKNKQANHSKFGTPGNRHSTQPRPQDLPNVQRLHSNRLACDARQTILTICILCMYACLSYFAKLVRSYCSACDMGSPSSPSLRLRMTATRRILAMGSRVTHPKGPAMSAASMSRVANCSGFSGFSSQGMEALQGEVKALTWTLANVGQADWPAPGTYELCGVGAVCGVCRCCFVRVPNVPAPPSKGCLLPPLLQHPGIRAPSGGHPDSGHEARPGQRV